MEFSFSIILNFFLFVAFVGTIGLNAHAQKPRLNAKGELMNMDELDLSSMAQPVPENNRFIDSAYNIWCGSVIKAENGKYYMFYSRWPKSEGHGTWITHSEIALAKDRGIPLLGIGNRCYIKNAIIDKNVRIGDDVRINGGTQLENKDHSLYAIKDGIVVVKKGAIIPNGFVIS